MSRCIGTPFFKILFIRLRSSLAVIIIAGVAAIAFDLTGDVVCATSPVDKNLALHKPASASSIENDDQDAAKANDGDDDTHWCADDEPENGAQWWQVDLQHPADLTGCRIVFPFDNKRYQYKVEGSGDGKVWAMLSDQTQTSARKREQDLRFNAKAIRFVKITITGFDEGCWASIAEVKVFGSELPTTQPTTRE